MIANIIFFALFLTVARAGYAGTYNGNYVGGGGAGGYGYGYGGGFPGYPQQFYAPIPFDFAQLMAGPNAKAYTSISVEPPFKGKISARARITFHGLNQIQARLQQQAAAAQQHSGGGAAGGYAYSGAYPSTYQGNSYPATYAPASIPRTNAHQGGSYNPTYPANTGNTGFSGGYGGGYGGSYGGGGGYGSAYGGSYGGSPQTLASYPRYGAGASASIGGGGVKQTAFLNPANPASPNVNVRFAGTPGGNSKSVFVSSSSSSGNVNGTPYHQRQASTTVNDNGKVSTYAVHDKK